MATTPPWSAEPAQPATPAPAEPLPSIDALGYGGAPAEAPAPSPAAPASEGSEESLVLGWPDLAKLAQASPAAPPAGGNAGDLATQEAGDAQRSEGRRDPGEPWGTAPGALGEPTEPAAPLPDESADAAAHGDDVFGWGAHASERPASEEKVGLYGEPEPDEAPPRAEDVVPATAEAEAVIDAAPPREAATEEPQMPPAVSALQDTMTHAAVRRSLYGDEAIYAAEPAEAWAHSAASTTGATDHVARALEMLAARVRRGELPVSHVPTDASPAGMLAAVLAAILGVGERR